MINMIKEMKYCSDVIKRCFNKEFAMTKKDNENFKKSVLSLNFLGFEIR